MCLYIYKSQCLTLKGCSGGGHYYKRLLNAESYARPLVPLHLDAVWYVV